MSTFSSIRLDTGLRDRLLDRLAPLHAARPLLPDDARGAAGRAEALLREEGLTAVRIRGTVSWRGVDVDHVWLAVQHGGTGHGGDGPAGDGPGWVLDAVFPLHAESFAGALPAYVAGLLTMAELAALAATAPLEARVIGALPAPAVYRGQPFWGRTN